MEPSQKVQTNNNVVDVWPAKTQTCLRIRADWSETLLEALILYECLSY